MVFEDERPDTIIGNVELKYEQPSVSVDTGGRFVTHNPIGDVTVRQKIGEEADEISIDGVCTVDEANDIDKLTEQETVNVVSNRWNGEAQVASTTTRPFTDGGGQDIDGEYLYTFTVELIEVTNIVTALTSPSVLDF